MKSPFSQFKGLDIVSCLLKIRAQRDSFSANERRIADFIVENSQYMRDYSSQQLASAVSVSQSSIVKFSQKLGYKGYPDLKLAINESVVKEQAANKHQQLTTAEHDSEQQQHPLIGLQHSFNRSLEHCISVNDESAFAQFSSSLLKAKRVVLLASQQGIAPCELLANKLLEKNIPCWVLRSDLPKDLAIMQKLEAGDLLLVVEDSQYSNSLYATVSNLFRQGVTTLLVNKYGDSNLHNVSNQQLKWVLLDEQPQWSSILTEMSIASLLQVVINALR